MTDQPDHRTPRFSLLDSVRAWRGDRELALGTPKEQLVLAILLFGKGSTVSTNAIIDLAWDGDPPPSAVGAVRTYVSRLRQVLQPEGAPQVLVRRSQGYALQVPPENVDLHWFDTLMTRARNAQSDGDHETAARLLRQGLRLWGPEPLAGLPGEFAESRREQLAERRVSASETRFESELLLGRESEILPELRPIAEANPLRERLQGQLMTALARTGRQSEALEAYTRTRTLLAEDLGMDPGDELQGLHRRVLSGEIRPPAQVPPRPMQLPAEPVGFAGRAEEVRQIGDTCLGRIEGAVDGEGQDPVPGPAQARGHRPAQVPDQVPDHGPDQKPDQERGQDRPPVTLITGIGGVGKTGLAVYIGHRLADRFPDGQLYVNLHGVGPEPPADPEAVLRSFLRALGVRTDDLPESLSECAARYRSTLADRKLLVVLDNAASAAQVAPLLPAVPGSATIVTSRHRLPELPLTRTVELDGLRTEEAHGLVASLIGPSRAAAEPEALRSLVAAGHGLPLAVRLLGARLASRPQWRIADLADRLADERRRLDELSNGEEDLSATFQLSYQQLDPAAARAFRLLAFCNESTLDGRVGAAVLGLLDSQVEGLCEHLVNAGLLQSPAPGWYGYHDLVRLFAVRCAERDEPVAARRDAVRQTLRMYLETLIGALTQVDPQDSLTRRVADRGGLPPLPYDRDPRGWAEEHADAILLPCRLAAEEFADGDGDLRLLAIDVVVVLFNLLDGDVAHDKLAEAARRLSEAGARDDDPRVRYRAYGAYGSILVHGGSMTGAIAVLREARTHLTDPRDAYHRARAGFFLADLLLHLGRAEESLRIARETGDGFELVGEPYDRAATTGLVARSLALLGRYEEAVAEGRRAIEQFRNLGATDGEAFAWYALGVVHHRSGACQEALRDLATARELYAKVGHQLWGAFVSALEAEVHLDLADASAATVAAADAYRVTREFGHNAGMGRALTALGHAARLDGDVAAARRHWEQALDVMVRVDSPDAAAVRALLDSL